uniref:DUF3089 domain-containing protein n=1 Tax=Haptolina ericina TaxID=156174 RepID=A0A7S3BYH7_9EUKA|mmetsp:Transcript_71382/g.158707  ORF Transcript_71382/g.158707 Transcript_71382/m.158707 type:complete len:397 (+) Transcript_71382:49-1239(+)
MSKPDYRKSAHWIACPPLGVEGGIAKAGPRVSTAKVHERQPLQPVIVKPDEAVADCFFVHGTIRESSGHPNIDSRLLMSPQTRTYQTNMISAFSHVARCFAPFYRMVTFAEDRPGGQEARWSMAFEDVAAAFSHFLEHWAAQRPLLLVGHSQGGVHVMRLLKCFFDGDNIAAMRLRARLVGCYAPGIWVTAADLPSHVPVCAGPGHVGSLAVWMCATETAELTSDTLVGRTVTALKSAPPIVVNPLTWLPARNGDGAAAAATAHLGALGVLPDGTPALFVDCCGGALARGGLLRLREISKRHAFLLAFYRGEGKDYHAFDLHLVWANVREQVRQQLENWLQAKFDAGSEDVSQDPALQQTETPRYHQTPNPTALAAGSNRWLRCTPFESALMCSIS